MAIHKENKEVDLFHPLNEEGEFFFVQKEPDTKEQLICNMKNNLDGNPDGLVVDNIGVKVNKSIEKLGYSKFNAIVDWIINDDITFQEYAQYKLALAAYRISVEQGYASRQSDKLLFHPKRKRHVTIKVPELLEGLPFVHIWADGSIAIEYMLWRYGENRTMELFTSMIQKEPPYDQDILDPLIELLITNANTEGLETMQELKENRELLAHFFEIMIECLTLGWKYAKLLQFKDIRDKILAKELFDNKKLLIGRIHFRVERIVDGIIIQEASKDGSWEYFKSEFEDLYADNDWNKKIIRNIVTRELVPNDCIANNHAQMLIFSLIKKYHWDIPQMFQSYMYHEDILIPYKKGQIARLISSLKRSPWVRLIKDATMKSEMSNTALFKWFLSEVPEVEYDNWIVYFSATRAYSMGWNFMWWPSIQRIPRVKDWVEERKQYQKLMDTLASLLEQKGIDPSIIDRCEESLRLPDGNGTKALSKIFCLDKDQWIGTINERLTEKPIAEIFPQPDDDDMYEATYEDWMSKKNILKFFAEANEYDDGSWYIEPRYKSYKKIDDKILDDIDPDKMPEPPHTERDEVMRDYTEEDIEPAPPNPDFPIFTTYDFYSAKRRQKKPKPASLFDEGEERQSIQPNAKFYDKPNGKNT